MAGVAPRAPMALTDPTHVAPRARMAARRRRPRTTSPRVRWIDRAATATITVGGLSVILAVLGMLVYLAAVVSPLFVGASIEREASYRLLPPGDAGDVLFAGVDEYKSLGICLMGSGEALVFDAATGLIQERRRLLPAGATLTAFVRSPDGATALGLADGTIRLGRIGFETSYSGGGGQRHVAAVMTLDEPLLVGPAGVPVALLDYRAAGPVSRLALLKSADNLWIGEISRRRNLLTGEESADIDSSRLPAPRPTESGPPAFLLLTDQGDQLYLAWRDGATSRYDLRHPEAPALAEHLDLAGGSGAALTALRFMPGDQTLLAGDSSGLIRAWFRVPDAGAGEDGHILVAAHTLPRQGSPITALAVSSRDRSFAAGGQDGRVVLYHATTERRLGEISLEPPSAVIAAQVTPKNDGLFALGADGRASVWSVRNPHPEASIRGFFGRIWYEGYPRAGFTWQSSSGTDDFEPKLSLVPLLFGTLKATLYSMLFAAPIALGAALYTSEFLDRRYRALLKSTIEMMASLPSVVLGFIAALVLAPLVENWVLAFLTAFALTPLAALALGYLWQALPPRFTLPLSGRPQIALLLMTVLMAAVAAGALASPLEALLFNGNFKAWLDDRAGTGTPGIGLLCWPPILMALLALDHRLGARRQGGGAALAASGRYLLAVAASVGLAWIAARVGTALGFDPRGSLLGTYVQRNALVVGFVMGFAVIPIIYTIAEDALASVPHTLRSASLGCGATRWQTATRVVLPVAIPGIFSALMIGLGRAIGETMIVLMAAGNTPLMDLNIFNGLRTLSANIAVELPEAVKDGTLYRTLFMAALLLFLITFAVNTLAEIVRQRFRRRTYQL